MHDCASYQLSHRPLVLSKVTGSRVRRFCEIKSVSQRTGDGLFIGNVALLG